MLDRYGWNSKTLADWVDDERGASRFIFMRGKEVTMLGGWFIMKGCYYSNLNWKINY